MDSGISELPSSPHGTPSPIMPHSPTRPRPSSGDRMHSRPASKRSYRQFIHRPTDGDSNSPSNSRPSSAFSNYNPLPHIGMQDISQKTSGSHDLPESHQTESNNSPNRTSKSCVSEASSTSVPQTSSSPRPPSAKKGVSVMDLRRKQFARRRNSQIDASASSEPSEMEPRLLLAIKLPNGQRLQRYFRPSDDFANVCKFAELEAKLSFSNCNMFINQVPKRLITNWKETFHEAGLTDRTLLCLEEKDD
ncbi:uncharacterized protein [Amphiura filiformis]|uniref:uncharacterized protein n=1 Tax=Amphiura filiformis TaxID=82378 RepID=UPI003B20F648